MKVLEEFESATELELKDLVKAMLASGVEEIIVKSNIVSLEFSLYGLISNVPFEQWQVLNDNGYTCEVGIKLGLCKMFCRVAQSERKEFTEITGFVFPEIDKNESK